MAQEIKCPRCGEVFTIDEAGYAAIVRQVRDEEFKRELKEQQNAAVQLAEAAKDKELDELRHQLSDLQAQNESAAKIAEAEKEKQLTALQEKLNAAQNATEAAVQLAEAAKDKELDELRHQLSDLQAQNEAAAKIAEAEKEREIASLQAQLSQKENESIILLKQKDSEIEMLRDMKMRLSTKMVGESLEQHCETEFNRIRAAAFPRAYFEKDNDAKEGSKGDYIFRDFSEDGTEYISIMFEMKNEMDTTATKHKNEDFFAKLDRDRQKKGCEYAVLVSLLETDNDYYNHRFFRGV